MAIFSHFENVYRNEGEAGGHITIIRLEEGWFWVIPLDEKKTSVGIVLSQEKLKDCGPDLESRFWNRVHSSAEASFRLKNASPIVIQYKKLKCEINNFVKKNRLQDRRRKT